MIIPESLTSLSKEIKSLKFRQLLVSIGAIVFLGLLVLGLFYVVDEYHALTSQVNIKSIDIHIPQQVLDMDIGITQEEFILMRFQDIFQRLLDPMVISILFAVFVVVLFASLNSIASSLFATLGILVIVCIFTISYVSTDNLRNLRKTEIIELLQSSDDVQFNHALNHISKKSINVALYIDYQYKIKHSGYRSIVPKDLSSLKQSFLSDEGIKDLPLSTAYLFNLATDDELLSKKAKLFEEKYYQEKKINLIILSGLSIITLILFCFGINVAIIMQKRLRRIRRNIHQSSLCLTA